MKWHKFPDEFPPEHKKMLVIDISSIPTTYNLAEYTFQSGWKWTHYSADNMTVIYWAELPEMPEDIVRLSADWMEEHGDDE